MISCKVKLSCGGHRVQSHPNTKGKTTTTVKTNTTGRQKDSLIKVTKITVERRIVIMFRRKTKYTNENSNQMR